MNPDKMRSEYGKLIYMLMDSADPSIQDLLEFKCVRPLRTVASLLAEKGGLRMLVSSRKMIYLSVVLGSGCM